MNRFLSFIPTLDSSDVQNIGSYPVSNFTAEGSNLQVVPPTTVTRWHWLPQAGTFDLDVDMVFGADDGDGHGYTGTAVSGSLSLPFSRTKTSMDELIAEIETNGGPGELFSLTFSGTHYVGGSHKLFTEPANDVVIGNYRFVYNISIGLGVSLAVPRSIVAYDTTGIYHLIQVSGSIGFGYDLISGSTSTGFPPGDPGTGPISSVTLYAIPYADNGVNIYNAGWLSVNNIADPTNNPITLGGGFTGVLLSGPSGYMLSTTTGIQNIDAQINITSNLTLPTLY